MDGVCVDFRKAEEAMMRLRLAIGRGVQTLAFVIVSGLIVACSASRVQRDKRVNLQFADNPLGIGSC